MAVVPDGGADRMALDAAGRCAAAGGWPGSWLHRRVVVVPRRRLVPRPVYEPPIPLLSASSQDWGRYLVPLRLARPCWAFRLAQ